MRQITDNNGRTVSIGDGVLNVKTTGSSSVVEWSWDYLTGSLCIAYHDRTVGQRTYRYDGVPFSVVAELLVCESVGKTVNAIVKGTYEYERV